MSKIFHPSVGFIWKVVRQAERTGMRGVFVASGWPGSMCLMLVEEKMEEGSIVF